MVRDLVGGGAVRPEEVTAVRLRHLRTCWLEALVCGSSGCRHADGLPLTGRQLAWAGCLAAGDDDQVAELLDQALHHVVHLRLGPHDTSATEPAAAVSR